VLADEPAITAELEEPRLVTVRIPRDPGRRSALMPDSIPP
jgi:hypothetical protein